MKIKIRNILFKSHLLFTINSVAFSVFAFSGWEQPRNYFQELIVPPTKIEDVEIKLENAIGSILERVKVPHVEGDDVDTQPIQFNNFFQKLKKLPSKKDPQIKAFLGGRSLQNILGYIYNKVDVAAKKAQAEGREFAAKQIVEVIDEIIHSNKELLSHKVFGLGSPIEVSLKFSIKDEQLKNEILDDISAFANSARKKEALNDHPVDDVLPLVQVENYESKRSVFDRRGGSTLDSLEIPLFEEGSDEHRKWKLKGSERAPDVFGKLILGEYEFLSPSDPEISMPDKQVVSALSPLTKLPFLNIPHNSASEKHMLERLKWITERVSQGDDLDPGALEEFLQIMMNIPEAGHNRFYTSDNKIEKAALALSESSKRLSVRNLSLISEYLPNKSLLERKDRDSCNLKESGVLMTENQKEDFFRNHTIDRTILHGTGRAGSALSILQKHLIVSSEDSGYSSRRGNAAYGRGFYSTGLPKTAQGYGRIGGILEFKIRKDHNLRILDWKSAERSPAILTLRKQFGLKDESRPEAIFRYLAEKCDVDIIFNKDIIIQNVGAIEIPKFSELRNRYEERLTLAFNKAPINRDVAFDMANAFLDYQPFQYIGNLIGLKEKDPELTKKSLAKMLENEERSIRNTAAVAFARRWPENKRAQSLLSEFHIEDALFEALSFEPNPDNRQEIILALKRIKPLDSDRLSQVLSRTLLNDPDKSVRTYAANAIRDLKIQNLDASLALVGSLDTDDRWFRRTIIDTLKQVVPKDKKVASALVNLLRSKNLETRKTAAELLQFLYSQNVEASPIQLKTYLEHNCLQPVDEAFNAKELEQLFEYLQKTE